MMGYPPPEPPPIEDEGHSYAKPNIESSDEIIGRQDVATILGITVRRVSDAMYRMNPPIPYVRAFRRLFFSKRQIGWWLQQIQDQPDSVAISVRHAKRELKGRS